MHWLVKIIRYLGFALFLLLASIPCDAQKGYVYRTVDRHCKDCFEFNYSNTWGFELKEIEKSDNEIELRLYCNLEFTSKAITVIIGNKNKFESFYYHKWVAYLPTDRPDSARTFTQWQRYPYKRFQIPGENLDSIFKELLTKNILTLPSQQDLFKNGGYYRTYTVVAKVNGIIKTYHFGNPNEYVNRYPNMHEFKEYQNIVSIFQSLSKMFYPTIEASRSK